MNAKVFTMEESELAELEHSANADTLTTAEKIEQDRLTLKLRAADAFDEYYEALCKLTKASAEYALHEFGDISND